MEYITRVIDAELDILIADLSAIVIEGPRAVGKTSTAMQRANTIRRLAVASDRAVIEADPRRLFEGDEPILIDEWQRLPWVWDRVREEIDNDSRPGRFILTGPAAPIETPAHSGAGRLPTLRMRPMSLAERYPNTATVSLEELLDGAQSPLSGRTSRRLTDYTNDIVSSGYPAISTMSGRAARTQLDGYIERLAERDLPEMGFVVRRRELLKRWMAAYAASVSTTTSWEKVRSAATPGEDRKPSRATTDTYRHVLEDLWIVDDIPAWSTTTNQLKRLGAAPEHQLADPALAARLLNLGAEALLAGTPSTIDPERSQLGFFFESLAALCVRVYAQHSEATVSHLRTKNGDHEVDLIVTHPTSGQVLAIEVKLKQVIEERDLRHIKWLHREIGNSALCDAIVLTTGTEAYRRTDGIGVVPLALLGP